MASGRGGEADRPSDPKADPCAVKDASWVRPIMNGAKPSVRLRITEDWGVSLGAEHSLGPRRGGGGGV